MKGGYSVLFDDDSCVIYDKRSGKKIFSIQMTKNSMFPIDVSVKNRNYALVATNSAIENLWHLCYGHLTIKGLQLLGKKNMILGMPKINALVACEGHVYGKQCRPSFPVSNAWRATSCLELVHANLWGPMSVEYLVGS